MKKALLIVLFLAFASAASFAQTSIQGREFSVRAYNAKGDGSTNDTSAFASAVAAVNASGGVLKIPAGTYLVDPGTITITQNSVTIEGDGPNVSVIKSRTGASGLIFIDCSATTPHSLTIQDLTLEGFGSGASNNGITISGANTPNNMMFKNIRILNFTGRGIYDTAGMFQSRLDNVVVTMASNGNNAIDLLGSNDLLLQNCYVTTVANSTAAYRIHSGRPTLISNNGVNPSSTNGSWAVFGDSFAEDGADRYIFATMIGNNIEDFTQYGVRFKSGSYGSFFGNSFIAPVSGVVTPLLWDFVDNGQRGIWDASNSIQTAGATYTNGYALNSRGAPFTQIGGNAFTSYYDTNIGSAITFPYLTPQLVAGSSNIALLTTRAQITNLEASGLVGDLTGATGFDGTASRVLLQAGTAARPTNTFVGDTDTGTYSSGADTFDITTGGSNRLSVSSNSTLTGNLGINTAGNSSYALDVASGALRVTNSNGSSTAAVEGKGNSNPYFLLTDTSASAIIGRMQALSGAPDRLAVGSFSNHPFGLYANSAERWTVGTSGNFTPAAASMYSIGSSTLPVADFTQSGKHYWNSTTLFDYYGSGSPEGVVTATVGSVYRRTNGSSGTTLYVKESGSGNTGWNPLSSAGASGVSTLNTLTGALTIASGTTGTDFNVAASVTTITLNLPDAGTSARGVVTTGSQTLAGAKTFTSVGTFNPSTTPQSAILIDINTLGSAGVRDSNWLVQRGRSNDGSAHLTEWKQFVDVNTNAGGSLWSLESRIDAGSFATRFTVSDAGAVSAGAFTGDSFTTGGGAILADDINAVTGFTLAGAATSGQYLRGNGTRFVSSAIQAGDLPATVVLTSAANTYTAGQKQTFAPNGTTAGINVGSVAGDPGTPANGDLWYDSTANELTARINGSNVALGSGSGGSVTGSGTSGKIAKFTGTSSIGDSIVSESGSVLTVTGDVVPEADNTRKMGTSSLRWSEVNVGPGSLHVRNDNTNTLKMSLGFSSTVAQIATDAASPMQLKVGSNTGVYFNTSGNIGFNTTSTPNGNYDFRQIANGDQMINVRRATDTTPTGNFLNFENAAGTDLFTVDNSGILTAGTIPAARIASGTISAANGGTGLDTSGSTGMPLITAGTWSVITTTGTGNAVRATSPTIAGGSHTAITSFGLRSSGTGAFDLTLANTENLTAGRTLTLTLNDASRTLTMGGNITTAAAFATSGANSLTLTTTGATNVTLPTTGTLATLAGAESLTNKKLGSLTTNGFVKTSGGDGTLSVDTNTYLTANQTITLSGDISGSGTTAITTTIGASKVTNAMLAGSITDDKLSQLTTPDKVADSALTTNVPLLNTTNTFTGGKQSIVLTDSGTSTVADVLDIQHVGGTVTTGFGSGIRFGLESTTTNNRPAANLNVQWTTATDASRASNMTIQLVNAGTLATKATLSATGDFTITGAYNGVTLAGINSGLTVATGKAVVINNSLTLAGTDSTTITFQGTDTYVGRTTTDTLTNKTLTASSNVLGGVTMTLGSDATGDMYTRSGGVLTRVGIGSTSADLMTVSGLPSWKRKVFSILAYGAVCDGSTTNDRAAIQAAIDAAGAAGGGVVSFAGCTSGARIDTGLTIGDGSGTYSTGSATASTYNDIEIEGASTKLRWYGSAGGTIITINGPIYRVKIRDLYINAKPSTNSAGTALDINHSLLSEYSNIYISENSGYGVRLRAYGGWTGGDGANGNIFDGVTISSTTAGAKGIDIGYTAVCSGCTLDPAQNIFRNFRARFDNGSPYVTGSIGINLNYTDASQFDNPIIAAATALQITVPTGTGGDSYPAGILFNNPALQGTTSFTVSGTWNAVEGVGFNNYLVGDAQTIPTHAKVYGVTSNGVRFNQKGDAGFIQGLQLEWVSATQVKINTGSAQIESTGEIVTLSTASTISPSLSASAWHYCYLYLSSGTPTVECVTTAPATAWTGTARSKTSATGRRYIGAIKTNGSSQIYEFYHNPITGYVQWGELTTASPFRFLNGGVATTITQADASAVVPPTAASVMVRASNTEPAGGQNAFLRSRSGSANVIQLKVGNLDAIVTMAVTSQSIYYIYPSAPSTGAVYLDALGYFDLR